MRRPVDAVIPHREQIDKLRDPSTLPYDRCIIQKSWRQVRVTGQRPGRERSAAHRGERSSRRKVTDSDSLSTSSDLLAVVPKNQHSRYLNQADGAEWVFISSG